MIKKGKKKREKCIGRENTLHHAVIYSLSSTKAGKRAKGRSRKRVTMQRLRTKRARRQKEL